MESIGGSIRGVNRGSIGVHRGVHRGSIGVHRGVHRIELVITGD